MSSSTRLHSTSLPGSMTHNDPLDGYNEDETYRDLPLAALPIAIDLEEDIIGILHYLPSDLVESIIDLVSDRETLKACTLVCRAWVPRSRKHLLDMSLVRMDRVKAESFIHLSTSPHFSLKRIPNLHLSFRGESSKMASQVVPLLSHHQVWVESLTVVADTFSSGSCKESLGLISAMWKMSVTELEIQNYLCDNLRDVLPFVHSFGCLEAFRLTGTFRGRVSARKLPSRLKKFTFSNSNSHQYSRGTEEVLHWLTSPKDGVPPRLLELNLKGLGGSGGLSELRKLLEAPTSRALQDLTLSSITFTHDDLIPDLQNLHSLRRFSIAPRITPQITDTLYFILKMIMSVSSHLLKQVELSIPGIPVEYLHEPPFRSLDEAFQESPALSGVNTFTIQSSQTVVMLLRHWLVRCQDRGIVEFVVTPSSFIR